MVWGEVKKYNPAQMTDSLAKIIILSRWQILEPCLLATYMTSSQKVNSMVINIFKYIFKIIFVGILEVLSTVSDKPHKIGQWGIPGFHIYDLINVIKYAKTKICQETRSFQV